MTNPVTKLEQFIVDSLVSSPMVPIGVNVMRLADTIDKEGVVQSSSNIIVSYSGGSSNIKNREPLVFEKSYIFKITFNCQDYLNTSAHDFALHLVDAATRTLSNQVPFVDGAQVIEPFYSSDETFEGITENSQYVYSQTWRLLSEELYADVSLDPCVRRGNCKAIWPPPGVVSNVSPGAIVTDDGKVWEVAGIDDCGNTVFGARISEETGDLILNFDDSIFIPKEELNVWTLDITNHITEDNKLEVWLRDKDQNQIERFFYTDTGKTMSRLQLDFYRSAIGSVGGCNSVLDFSLKGEINTSGTYAYINTICAPLYVNPLTSTESRDLSSGSLISVLPENKLIVNGQTFIQVIKTDLNDNGWIDERAITVRLRSEIFPAETKYREEIDTAFDADNNTIL